MKKERSYAGAENVLENYIIGALADMENNMVMNYNFVYEAIMGLIALGGYYAYEEYLNRFNKYIKDNHIEFER